MAVIKVDTRKDVEIPSDYVRCSKEEAIIHQWKLIKDWKPASDVWPYKYGIALLTAGAAFTSMTITSIYRRKLKLFAINPLWTLIPNVIPPALILPVVHQKFVSEPILIQSECPVCVQVRAIALQNFFGIGYPIILGAVSGFMLAHAFATRRLPVATMKGIPEHIRLARDAIAPYSRTLIGMAVAHTVAAAFITQREAKALFYVVDQYHEQSKSSNV